MSLACRTFLREALGDLLEPARAGRPDSSHLQRSHLEQCSFCRARVAAGDQLAAVLVERPKMPAAAEFAAVLERVHEQVVEAYEGSPLGAALAEVPEAPVGSAAAAWDLPLLGSELARDSIIPPAMPSAAAWMRVRANILSEATSAPSRLAPRLVFGLLGTVAAAGLVLLFVELRPNRVPHIEFAELQTMPAVDFAFVRHGVNH